MRTLAADTPASAPSAFPDCNRPAATETAGEVHSPVDAGVRADARLFALMRLFLACASLFIIYIDPTEPQSRVELTYGTMAGYCVYAAAVAAYSFRVRSLSQRLICAIDLLFACSLMLLTEGTNSIFFYAFLFPILVASFSGGFRDGMAVTVIATLAFITIGILADPPLLKLELNLSLIRPVYLLGLGYMIAEWGGREHLLKRRLELLRQVNDYSAARLGVDAVIQLNLQRLLSFYRADQSVLLVKRHAHDTQAVVYSAKSGETGTTTESSHLSEELTQKLVGMEIGCGFYYATDRGQSLPQLRLLRADGSIQRRAQREPFPYDFAAAIFETPCYVAAAYAQDNGTRGRLFVTGRSGRFAVSELAFLLQFSAAMAKAVENVQLMDEIVVKAAEEERRAMSRDIHDAAIQPYLGLRLGLEALNRDNRTVEPVREKVRELIEMVNVTVSDLRGYSAGLDGGSDMPTVQSLRAPLDVQAQRFTRFYGIDVGVEISGGEYRISRRLATEILHLVLEGLSNVLKHTSAKTAAIEVQGAKDSATVSIRNSGDAEADRVLFVPKSIQRRVEFLSGRLQVVRTADGDTVVKATIPSR